MNVISIHETSIILGLPEFLIRDFVSYEFNGKRLGRAQKDTSDYEFELSEVDAFRKHLDEPWPGTTRQDPPDYVKRYLIYEAQGVCALCRAPKPNYEYAHIRPWAESRCNSPHNVLRLCLDCHTSYGTDAKLMRGVKEESIRRIQLIDLGLLYGCDPDMSPGEAVYVLEGQVHRACADSTDGHRASGFVQTKIGVDRCIVQRSGVLVSVGGLEPGEDYCLSPTTPGKIVTRAVFDAVRDMSAETMVQLVGRAESSTHLAIGDLFGWMRIRPGALIHH